MVYIPVECPHCNSTNVLKYGTLPSGKQRYICKNQECSHKTFILDYTYNACDPYVREQIFFQTVNGSGTRAISRSLNVDKDTVTSVLRSLESNIWHVNKTYIEEHRSKIAEAELVLVEEAEMDEMWSFVHDKSQEYWLWWAIDHNTGEPLAFCFGTRQHANLENLLDLLEPYNIEVVYADGNPAYDKHILNSWLITGKENTQKIERKHLSLRTWCSRLVRKGIRFSKRHDMHVIVIGLVINFWFFSRIAW